MVATLTVTSPAAPGSRPTVTGSGFEPKTNVSIVFRGVGTTYKVPPKSDGGFSIGLAVVTTTPEGDYIVEARKAGTTTVLATAPLTVKKPVVTPPPPVDPPLPPTGTRPIYGCGSQVTGGAGHPDVAVTHIGQSGVGSLAYALQGGDRRIVFMVEGTINIPSDIIVRSSNITIAGATAPGKGITLTGAELTFGYGAVRNIIVTDIRHRGFGPTGAQVTDCISPVVGTKGVILARLSLSGANDETIGIWQDVHDVTIQDCILGPHQPASMAHNFAALVGGWSTRVSFLGNLISGSNYRNPAIGWDKDAGDVPPSLDAPEIVGDVINNVIWDYIQYGTSVYHGGKANVVGNLYKGRTNSPVEVIDRGRAFLSGNVSADGYAFPASNAGRFPVPAYAVIPEDANAWAAGKSVLDKAGCRVGGLDAFDQNIIDRVRAEGRAQALAAGVVW